MKVVTAAEMRRIDEKTIKAFGLSSPVLMERAGLAVAAKVRELFGKRKVIVLSGGGNNGGDGIVAGRELFRGGWNVRVLLLAGENRLSPDCLKQYRTAKKMGLPIEFRSGLRSADLHSAVVIDAIFGTGINKPVGPPVSEVIAFLNRSEAPVFSVDIPSGISADNGEVLGEAVRADYTVTFGLPKIGHLLHPGAEYCGELFVEDIGFPAELLTSDGLMVETIDDGAASSLIPERPVHSYKGNYGHVLVVAGSRGKTGAALMTARACLRSGAGMVTVGVPETLADIFQARVTEEMVLPLPDAGGGQLSFQAAEKILRFVSEKADVLAVGPGIGTSDDIRSLIPQLIGNSVSPMVIDADGINSLEGSADSLKKARSPVILTPHIGEMARLLHRSAADYAGLREKIAKDGIQTPVSFSKETGTYLILKGAPSVVAEPEGRAFINTTGNPGMATAGAGDVLTGVVAGFLGQGLNPLNAAMLGLYMHGLAGDIAASEKGMHSMIATDIIDHLQSAFASLRRDQTS
jgi:hydroxyethylthiazole kinase-like uncharacterized protein yjeF